MEFKWEIYKLLNPELNFKTPQNYIKHYNSIGKKQGRKFSIYQFNPGFNFDIYKNNYTDLKDLNNIQLQIHYILIGSNQKRICDKPIERIDHTIFSRPINDLELFNFIEKIFYINLDHRTDRKKEIENEFMWANISSEKVIRIPAIMNKFGALGCSASHIKCLKLAKQLKLENVLILEDDFSFRQNTDLIIDLVNSIKNFKEDWDIFLFGGNKWKVDNYTENIDRVVNVQTTSGYLVKSSYFDKLLNNFIEGYNQLSKTRNRNNFAIDVYWKKLQTDRWFITNPTIGFQRFSFSNIENKMAFYSC